MSSLSNLRSRLPAGTAFALLLSALLFAAPRLAWADATTGLWPNVSVPPQEQRSEPSNDAALVIGIDHYDALPRVFGAADNARDWEKYFLFGRRVAPERVSLLTDQNATSEAIAARAKELAAKVPAGGTLFVVFIGHGAPAQGGQKGLLLGADVRPSDASFAARSLSYDQLESLVSAGTQARTVMVLDACFSGIDAGGKTLLPNVQPVVATTLIASAKTTVFSAGTAAEYAGALPGSQRPALSYLLLGAMRGWADNDGDGKVTVDEAAAYASMVLRSLPNNHEQHPQVLNDSSSEPLESNAKEKAPDLAVIRSKLDTWRPPVDRKPEPKLRVSVGCGDPEPRGSDDGLVVYIDHSAAVAVPSGGEKKWDPVAKRNVVDFIEYPITPGAHHVLVRLPGCQPAEMEFEADASEGAHVRGLLRVPSSVLVRGPAGSPNWGRIALALWLPRTFGGEGVKISKQPGAEGAYGDLSYDASATGVFVQPSLTFRWWSLGIDLGYAAGSTQARDAPAVTTPALRAAIAAPDVRWMRAGLRTGARFPFNVAAFSIGVGGGWDDIFVDKLPDGTTNSRGRNRVYGSLWTMIDVQVLCDWPLFAGFDAQVHNEGLPTLSILVGAAFQPNTSCKAEGTTRYGLTHTQPASSGRTSPR